MTKALGLLAIGALVLAVAACSQGANEGSFEPDVEAGPGTEIVTMYVGPELVDCVGVAPMKCMLVKRSLDEDWTMFYDKIAGFEFEPGYEYELLVEIAEVPNPPADASSLSYTLVEVVNKTEVAPVAVEDTGEPGEEAATEPEGEEMEEPVSEITLEGTMWVLDSYGDPAEPTPVVADGPEVTLTFLSDEGQIAGSAGCNSYFGGYELDGDMVTFGLIGSTQMACVDEAVNAQETAFLQALSTVEAYALEGDVLSLVYQDGQVLSFHAQVPTALEGTVWEVTGYNNGVGGVTSLVADTELTLLFEDGTVSGSAGCNTFHGTYELDGDAISMGPLATTRKMCAEPIMEQESLFLAAVGSASVLSVTGTDLELRRDDGALAVQAQAKPLEEE